MMNVNYRQHLAKKRKVEDETCLFYSEKETSQHLFFECVVARQCWALLSNIVGVPLGENTLDIGKLAY
jgi:hypothetical protein